MVLIELRKIFSLHVRFANFFHQLGFDITHTLYFIFLAVVRKAYVQTYVRYKNSVYNAPKKFYTKYKKKRKNLGAGEVGTLGGKSKLRRTAAMHLEQDTRGLFSPRQLE